MSLPAVDVVVRAAQQSDVPALQRIFRRASLSNPGDRAALLAHPEVLRLADDLIGQGRTRVATLPDGTIIGFAGTSVTGPGRLELEDLFVDPDSRRHGAATRLVEQIAAEAAAEQVTSIDVIANPHAMDFYRAVGFKGAGPVATPFGEGTRMRLAISG